MSGGNRMNGSQKGNERRLFISAVYVVVALICAPAALMYGLIGLLFTLTFAGGFRGSASDWSDLAGDLFWLGLSIFLVVSAFIVARKAKKLNDRMP